MNEEIARIFERMARALALKEADRFRIIAYERAAASIRHVEDLAGLAREGRLEEIPGIGKDLAEMIEEYLRTGKIQKYERERRDVPDGLIDLMSIPGLGPKTVALLRRRLGVENLEDLQRAIEDGSLVKLPRLARRRCAASPVRSSCGSAGAASAAGSRLAAGEPLGGHPSEPLVEKADLAGWLRRGRETIGDVDILIASKDGPRALAKIAKLPVVRQTLGLGDTKATLVLDGPVQVDVRAVQEPSYGAALLYFTGSKDHNVRLRTLAKERGLKINEYGVLEGERNLGGTTEAQVYGALGLPLIPPELREDRGEIEAAKQGALPRLIELGDLRGDFHVHTDYSDGQDSMERMVEQAEALGYDYVGLADHSPAARIAHGLAEDRLEEKIEAVEGLRRARRGGKLKILIGAEADILGDGRLDYPERILRRLDVVIAAVHSAFRQDSERMTGRLLDALDCPYVHILAHPTGRLLGVRDPIRLDFDAVVKKAIDRRIALEVSGAWQRLDLNDVMAKAAQDAGALLAIGSDAHSAGQMENVRYGVLQARRGWIEAKSVVNTWSWSKLDKWLKR